MRPATRYADTGRAAIGRHCSVVIPIYKRNFVFASSFCGTSQVNDDFHSAGLGRHHFKRDGTSGPDAYSALGDASGHQTVSDVSRSCQSKSMIVFSRSSIGSGEAEDSNGR
jgi:hypothetical protein